MSEAYVTSPQLLLYYFSCLNFSFCEYDVCIQRDVIIPAQFPSSNTPRCLPRQIPKALFILPRKNLLIHIHCCLFTGARKWNEPRCRSTDEWIMKKCHMHTMEY